MIELTLFIFSIYAMLSAINFFTNVILKKVSKAGLKYMNYILVIILITMIYILHLLAKSCIIAFIMWYILKEVGL